MESEKAEETEEKQFDDVFLEVTSSKKIGRIIIGLYNDCPKTAKNFTVLCTGELGKGYHDQPMCYTDTYFHRVVPNTLIQAGDITREDGTGGESIYGRYFDDENFINKHDKPYTLGMANCGAPDTNSS